MPETSTVDLLARRARLHAGRNLFRKQFQQQIGHQPNLGV